MTLVRTVSKNYFTPAIYSATISICNIITIIIIYVLETLFSFTHFIIIISPFLVLHTVLYEYEIFYGKLVLI